MGSHPLCFILVEVMIVHVLAFEVVTLLLGVWECDWAYLPPGLQEHQSI